MMNQSQAVVAGAIVHQNHFKRAVGLFFQTQQAPLQCWSGIEDRYDD
jgi:menaquinone-dependent protoporphyrinogen IX oxidase